MYIPDFVVSFKMEFSNVILQFIQDSLLAILCITYFGLLPSILFDFKYK